MLNHYETAFILTPVLSDVQMKEAVEKLTKSCGVCVNWRIPSRKNQPVFMYCFNLMQNHR